MTEYVRHGSVDVARELSDFIEAEALPGTGVDPARFWQGFSDVFTELAPVNRALVEKRESLQREIDAWHRARRGKPHDAAAYKAFLTEIGYLLPDASAFEVATGRVDDEIARVAGPQLVVPILNARYALNAANARWGSLYDALYGTDAIPDADGAERGRGYNPKRGAKVVAYAKALLDQIAPLAGGALHADATGYAVEGGKLAVSMKDGRSVGLADPAGFAGYAGDPGAPDIVLLKHHGLHAEIVVDRDHAIGKDDAAGVADVVLESAMTVIQDCEDSIAAVDAEDKVAVYRNWLGLMKGTLTAAFPKGGTTVERALNPDRSYVTPDGGELTLPGRSLMLIRNVGHLMTTDAVKMADGSEAPEGILDAAGQRR